MLTRSCIFFDIPFLPLVLKSSTSLARLCLTVCDFNLNYCSGGQDKSGGSKDVSVLHNTLPSVSPPSNVLSSERDISATSADPEDSLETRKLKISSTSYRSGSHSFLVKVLTLT